MNEIPDDPAGRQMSPIEQIVLSASRRTDIPAFYMPWFMDRIARGNFEVVNPYNRRVSVIPVSAGRVHTIVFWSKDFGAFIRDRCGERLQAQGYHLFFNFTVNSESPLLEPRVPPLAERLAQMDYLGTRFGASSVQWRFDPICFYETRGQRRADNLDDFDRIAQGAAHAGIRRCVTSFMDHYPKVRRRAAAAPEGVAFMDPTLETKRGILGRLQAVLGELDILLFACCEPDALASLPADAGVSPSACVPNHLLRELFGGHPPLRRDSGQRVSRGCRCGVSVDIGSYRHHPCYHNCLFCYANPTALTP